MNPKKTLILAAVLVAATVYLLKVSIPRQESEAKTQAALKGQAAQDLSSVVVSLGEPSVESYMLVRAGAQPAQGEGAEGTAQGEWELDGLKGAVLERTAVAQFVEALLGLKVTGPISQRSQSQDFSTYGLDKPALTLVAHGAGGAATEIALGKENAFLSQRYAKVSGRDGIFMVETQPFTALNKRAADLRSRTPLKVAAADVREITLESPKGKVKVAQPVVGEWKIVEPRELPASSEDVDALVASISGLSAQEFLDGQQAQLARFGLDKPAVKILMLVRPGLEPQARTISVASQEAEKSSYFFYEGAPSVFKSSADAVATLSRSADDLRDKRLFGFSGSAIASIQAQGAGGAAPVEIVEAKGDWEVNKKAGDPVFVDDYLNDVAALKASEFPDAASVPKDAFADPFLSLTIVKKGDAKEPVLLVVGKARSGPAPAPRYARVGDNGPVVLIADVEAKRIVPHEEALLPAKNPAPLPRPGR